MVGVWVSAATHVHVAHVSKGVRARASGISVPLPRPVRVSVVSVSAVRTSFVSAAASVGVEVLMTREEWVEHTKHDKTRVVVARTGALTLRRRRRRRGGVCMLMIPLAVRILREELKALLVVVMIIVADAGPGVGRERS